ncbi:hypothetical protein LCGC14_1401720 [marine sediment metagenome]|uniref:Uncharacterized protein n=1 Tax=marine sediment metagenome TaxID=412755 RepID=A0A0F9JX83_9ZZZZ
MIGSAWTFGPWCLTWDIPNAWEDPLVQLGRAVVATWQPLPHSIAELIPNQAKRYKSKLGGFWL